MVSPEKNQVENVLNKIFDFRGHNIDVSGKDAFALTVAGIHDKEGGKSK